MLPAPPLHVWLPFQLPERTAVPFEDAKSHGPIQWSFQN